VIEPTLREGAAVTLDAGGDTTMLPCRIVGIIGDELALLPLRPPDAPLWHRLAMRREVMVLFDTHGGMRALRGRAAGVRSGGYLAVVLFDAFRLGQKRRHSRAPLAFPAELTEPEGGSAWTSVTQDISAAGMRVERPDVEDPARAGTARLDVPDRAISARATLVAAGGSWLSYRLEDMEAADANHLAGLVLAYHRAQLKR
jgi:hypothetical protein